MIVSLSLSLSLSLSSPVLAMTTPNPLITSIIGASTTENVWTLWSISYWAAVSSNLTLRFELETNNKFNWYLDDVSLTNSSSAAMVSNGDFEAGTLAPAWQTGSSGSCSSSSGLSTSQSHSSTQSYYTTCNGATTWISQSFVATAGSVYSVTFWTYLDRIGSGTGSGTVQVDVRIS
jgi:hypothetical protein